jgi:hypothetical protein
VGYWSGSALPNGTQADLDPGFSFEDLKKKDGRAAPQHRLEPEVEATIKLTSAASDSLPKST